MKETTVCRDEGPVCEVVAAGDRKLHHASVPASERRRRRLELQRIRHTPEVNHVAKRSRCRIQDDRPAFHSDSSADSTDARTHDGWPAAASLSRGAVSVIGRRREMEDAVAVAPALLASSTPAADADRIIGGGTAAEEDVDFFAVYDGHGGARVAEACSERLHVVLADEFRRRNGGDDARSWKDAVAASFARVDAEVTGGRAPSPAVDAADLDSPFRTVGSTAVVAVVGHRRVVVANCGDSRAVLSRAGVAVPLSTDHKPDRPDELERVEAAGGRVINWNGYRVLGVLATSRSIGDYYLKPFVSAEPEVTVVERTDQDEFLILASDGLWDVVSNEVACKIARNCLNGRAASMFPEAVSGCTATDAAALLTELAMARGSKDNISVVVVELRRLKGSS